MTDIVVWCKNIERWQLKQIDANKLKKETRIDKASKLKREIWATSTWYINCAITSQEIDLVAINLFPGCCNYSSFHSLFHRNIVALIDLSQIQITQFYLAFLLHQDYMRAHTHKKKKINKHFNMDHHFSLNHHNLT